MGDSQAIVGSIPADVQDWVAYALVVGHDDQTIMSQLAGAVDWSPETLRSLLAQLRASPLFRLGTRLARDLNFCHWHFALQARIRDTSVDRIQAPEVGRFFKDYLAVNRPVLIDGLVADWPALQKWTPERLTADYGDLDIEYMQYTVRDRVQVPTRVRRSFREFLHTAVDETSTDKSYWTAYNQNDPTQPLSQALRQDIRLPEGYCDAAAKEPVFFWIGPKGTRSGLHFDPQNVLFVQVTGRKRWVLAPPWELLNAYVENDFFCQVDVDALDRSRFPRYRPERQIEFELGPGDALLVPVGWFHQVTSLSFSASVSLTNLALPGGNDFESPSCHKTLL